jgi:NAD+ diphosphatase
VSAVTAPSPDGFAPSCGAVQDPLPDDAAWVILRGDELLLAQRDGGPCSLLTHPESLGLAPENLHALGSLDGRPALLGTVSPEAPLPEGVRAEGLRGAFMLLRDAEQAMAAYGAQIRHWDRTTRFCGECGRATSPSADPAKRAKRCETCRHDWFPRVSPCTIALVYDDAGRVLLTRQPSWPANRYGLIAGFVEPGETLEECVRREAREETGVELADVTYAGSQPWPFPHQLMVGFTAKHVSGDPRPRDGELEDARWFTRDALPILPPRFSIARRLIDAFLAR